MLTLWNDKFSTIRHRLAFLHHVHLRIIHKPLQVQHQHLREGLDRNLFRGVHVGFPACAPNSRYNLLSRQLSQSVRDTDHLVGLDIKLKRLVWLQRNAVLHSRGGED